MISFHNLLYKTIVIWKENVYKEQRWTRFNTGHKLRRLTCRNQHKVFLQRSNNILLLIFHYWCILWASYCLQFLLSSCNICLGFIVHTWRRKSKTSTATLSFIEASCNSSYLAVLLRVTSLSFRIKSLKDLQRASSIPSSRPKFSLYPIIPMVIFCIPHLVHTFNPESRQFYFKIPDTGFQIRQITHPEKTYWGPPSRVVKVVTSGYSAYRAPFIRFVAKSS